MCKFKAFKEFIQICLGRMSVIYLDEIVWQFGQYSIELTQNLLIRDFFLTGVG